MEPPEIVPWTAAAAIFQNGHHSTLAKWAICSYFVIVFVRYKQCVKFSTLTMKKAHPNIMNKYLMAALLKLLLKNTYYWRT